jgi:predicted nucleic acid-binding protein
MSRYKVLVDSSVWIDFFKGNEILPLERLIQEDLVCTNEIILCEILPYILLKKRNDIAQSLLALEKIALSIDWRIIQQYQFLNLRNGIDKVGIPDLIILQQVIDEKLTLFSFDKHFKLMKSQFEFELINNN